MNGKKSTFCSLQSPSTVVVGKKRVRNTLLHVWLSPDERAKIQERMADVGIRNLSAYVRKMALNGYVLHVDLAPVKDIVHWQGSLKFLSALPIRYYKNHSADQCTSGPNSSPNRNGTCGIANITGHSSHLPYRINRQYLVNL